jgi:hypothetical protein
MAIKFVDVDPGAAPKTPKAKAPAKQPDPPPSPPAEEKLPFGKGPSAKAVKAAKAAARKGK